MRALAYFCTDPDAGEGGSAQTQAQTRAFQEFCAAHGHTPLGVFSDAAATPERPQYQEMLVQIRSSSRGYLVVVQDISDLGDTLEEQVERTLEVDALDCQVVCAAGAGQNPLQAALGAWEAGSPGSARRERIREGMRARAARAQALGKTPYGYRVGEGGSLDPVAAEAEVVRTIYRLYLDENLGVRAIARRLNDQGYLTRRGERWSMVTIRDILRNHAYIGTYRRFGLRIPGSYQPIVAADEFRRVQDRMHSRSPQRRHPRQDPVLLAGLLYCGECDGRMMSVVRHQTWRRKSGERMRGEYRYYQCQSRANRNLCRYNTQRAEELEEAAVRLVRTGTMVPVQDGEVPGDALKHELDQEAAKARSLERRYREWVQRSAEGAIALGQLRAALEGVRRERQVVAQRLALLDGGPVRLRQEQELQRQRARDSWASLDGAQRQETLRSLVSKIVVTGNGLEVVPRIW